ncbi:hypothetical protein [Kitasatospora cathayae]|uniref:Uncharacterized protein n=1 Tax=Kitasatospora cathayae TaxID=3004092 RepID=A0ABY7Q8A1_9ACTN|nr:hypothetical protein [Kitasatospora sp. HUAS 3-15]WBP88894.1 hypothetical protein O1G21_25700 [Kitasatospora sp. HUAS 3-15]
MERRREAALTGGTAGRRLTSIDGGREDGPAEPAGPPPQGPGGARGPRPQRAESAQPPGVPEQARLWHVVLSVAGQTTPLSSLRASLERLAHDHSFFLTARYAADHAEIRYWEQARDLHDAAAIALRLWGEHKVTANLPPWEIVGLEVVDRATYQKRVAEGFGGPPPQLGGVYPY